MDETWENMRKTWENDEKLGLKEKPSESTKLLTPLNFGRKEENLVRFG